MVLRTIRDMIRKDGPVKAFFYYTAAVSNLLLTESEYCLKSGKPGKALALLARALGRNPFNVLRLPSILWGLLRRRRLCRT
jgi:hypothetical protein